MERLRAECLEKLEIGKLEITRLSKTKIKVLISKFLNYRYKKRR